MITAPHATNMNFHRSKPYFLFRYFIPLDIPNRKALSHVVTAEQIEAEKFDIMLKPLTSISPSFPFSSPPPPPPPPTTYTQLTMISSCCFALFLSSSQASYLRQTIDFPIKQIQLDFFSIFPLSFYFLLTSRGS